VDDVAAAEGTGDPPVAEGTGNPPAAGGTGNPPGTELGNPGEAEFPPPQLASKTANTKRKYLFCNRFHLCEA
jgi:hypothetical protein